MSQFNPPPGWPTPPPGWRPTPGWAPDPAWPPAPPGWSFWAAPTPPRLTPRRVVSGLIVGAIGLGFALYQGLSAESGAPSVGQCAKIVGHDHVVEVDCEDLDATLRVTKRVAGSNDGEEACADEPTSTWYYVYESQATSFVLCLTTR